MDSPTQTGVPSWTIQRLLTWTTDFLHQRGVGDPRLSCELLLAHATGYKRIELYTRFDQVLADEVLATYRECVKRAADHEPIAYLVGEKEFFSLGFTVTPDVLIPRSETETLVEVALDFLAKTDRDDVRILDLGTGSGCVVIAILTQRAEATAIATDISPQALAVARKNAERHGVADRLRLLQTNCFTDVDSGNGFDCIVSNPPYIAAGEMDEVAENVRKYEPHIALTDQGDGLSFYRALAEGGAMLLRDGGMVAVEVADARSGPVRGIFESVGSWENAATLKDRVVGLERVLVFRPSST
ncbi:MAG: peptide chain release factor N(5)-glutamine methyltransferase [Phycisphaerae bacterium]